MPRFYFDIHDASTAHLDDLGQELPNLDAVRREAMRTLPQIAYDAIPKEGDRQTYTVVVSDDDSRAVYAATLNFTGQWLMRPTRS